MEPLYKGHAGTRGVLYSEVKLYTKVVSFIERCPLFGVSFIRGATVFTAGTAPDTCGDPGTPASGTKIGTDYRIGATVYYECDSGYTLDGPGSRQCQQSGVWAGDLPQCIEKGTSLKIWLILPSSTMYI